MGKVTEREKDMHALVSLLSEPYYEKVQIIWEGLETHFGMKGVQITPFPHFSWQIGQYYAEDRLFGVMQKLSREIAPFTVHTTGLGMFSGTKPVIFIPVIKSLKLVKTHERLWKKLKEVGEGLSPYYHPLQWVPHISLVYEDLNEENVGEIMKWLSIETYKWSFEVNNLSYIYEPDGAIGDIRLKVSLDGITDDGIK